MDFPEHPFWDFAIGIYGREGVSRACLHLQERHGIDVNVMLFCLWLGESGRGTVSDEEMAALKAISDEWQGDVVRNLRAARRALKDGFPGAPEALRQALRAEVQGVEIDSEHLEQMVLAGAIERAPAEGEVPPVQRANDASRNFARYVAALGCRFEPADTVSFAHVLGQTFRDLSPDQALDLAEVLMVPDRP